MQVIFEFLTSMATRDRTGKTLSVNLGEDVIERLGVFLLLEQISQTEAVKSALEDKMKPRAKEIAAIIKMRKKVTN